MRDPRDEFADWALYFAMGACLVGIVAGIIIRALGGAV